MSHPSLRRFGAFALAIAGLTGACSQVGAVASPTASAVPAGPTASSDGPRQILGTALAPGTYTTTLFHPPLTLTLTDSWLGLFPDDEDEIAFERNAYTEGFYISRVAQVVDPTTRKVISAPADLVQWLSAHPSFKPVGAPADVTVAGIKGRAVELDVIGAAETEVFAYPTGNTRVHPGSRLRYVVLAIGGPVLVLTCFGTSRAAFDEASPLVEASLASLVIRE